MTTWIDTHCHLDAPEFNGESAEVRQRATRAGVAHCVLPAVEVGNFARVRELAHDCGYSYALGIHPLCVATAGGDALPKLDHFLRLWANDPRLVAVGEIGLDYFVPQLCSGPLRERQEDLYLTQLKLARLHGLPVLLHVRRSVDRVLHGLRRAGGQGHLWRGIAHAFVGSPQQADACLALGLKLGFGGALTFERATRLRQLATNLPLSALVMETDSPDIPPHWIYRTAEQRAAGQTQGRNEPAELPGIARHIAELRGIDMDLLAQATTANALDALPRLRALLV